jgi:hypothetical protein
MNSSIQLIEAAKIGFAKWLSIEGTCQYIMAERTRMPGRPARIYVVAYMKDIYGKLDLDVIKMTKLMNEDGTLRDVELTVINERTTDPLKILGSSFVFNESLPHMARFSRVFATASDRDVYFDDLKLMNELQVDYNLSYMQALRLGLIKKNP